MVEAKKIEVAETGNKRKEVSDDDVKQAINDLGSFLKEKGYEGL